ncbi:MAG: porin [candidate division FCPU426 bacterium]
MKIRSRKIPKITLLAVGALILGSVHVAQGAVDPLQLEQRVLVLERQIEIQKEESEAKKQTAVTLNADRSGFSFYNADKSWGLKIGGLVQADARIYFGDTLKPQNNSLLPRRARLQLDANIGAKLKLRLQEDFVSGSVVDAYGELKPLPYTTLRFGLFKTPLSLERWRSDPTRDWVELGYTGSLVTDRDSGAWLELADADQAFSLGAGVFNGNVNTSNIIVTDSDDDKDVVLKFFSHPFRALDSVTLRDFGFGIAGSSGYRGTGSPLPTYKSLGQSSSTIYAYAAGTTVTGASWRVVPQAYLFWNSLSILGEYVRSVENVQRANTGANKVTQAELGAEAWQIQLGWVLTGGDPSFNGLKLDKGSSGALQFVGRYQELAFDPASFNRLKATGTTVQQARFADPRSAVSQVKAWGLGINYVPVDNLKLQLDWEQSLFKDGASSGTGTQTRTVDRETENVLFARAQFNF